MNKNEAALICAYVYNNEQRLRDELKELVQRVRYRDIDIYDCVELVCAMERMSTFKQTTTDILSLMKVKPLKKIAKKK